MNRGVVLGGRRIIKKNIFAAILVNELLAPRVEAKRAIVAFKRKKWKEDEQDV